jgi:hypothetical protein
MKDTGKDWKTLVKMGLKSKAKYYADLKEKHADSDSEIEDMNLD